MLLEELRSEFILDCQIRNLSKRTIETYELNISLFLRWLEIEMKVKELSPLNKKSFQDVCGSLTTRRISSKLYQFVDEMFKIIL